MQPDPGFKPGVWSRVWVVSAELRHRIPPHSCHMRLQAPQHQGRFPLSLQFPSARVHISAHSQNGPVSDGAEQLGVGEPGIPRPKSPRGMLGEAFAKHTECTRDCHVLLNAATGRGAPWQLRWGYSACPGCGRAPSFPQQPSPGCGNGA